MLKYRKKHLQQILHENNIFMSETDAIRELNKPGDTSVGYRAMTVRIRQAFKINVSRQAVSNSQERVDPEGKARRLKRVQYNVPGPNYMWHIDGYVFA